ncbi:MAG: helix-turn-helix transcriptional regulator [Anaerolineales bacterium]
MVTFSDWLANELNQRGMSPADLARATNKAQAVISRILSNERRPAPETLESIARALKLPPEIVFRRAGLLPPVSPDIEYREELLYLFSELSPDEQEEIIELLRFKKERKTKELVNPARMLLKAK